MNQNILNSRLSYLEASYWDFVYMRTQENFENLRADTMRLADAIDSAQFSPDVSDRVVYELVLTNIVDPLNALTDPASAEETQFPMGEMRRLFNQIIHKDSGIWAQYYRGEQPSEGRILELEELILQWVRHLIKVRF